MVEHPILFSAARVKATLENRMTQFRRPTLRFPAGSGHVQPLRNGAWEWSPDGGFDRGVRSLRCPYGVPGDRLWVRETWQMFDPDTDGIEPTRFGPEAPFSGVANGRPIRWRAAYAADGPLEHQQYGPANWKPSSRMPRWASRLLLDVVAVRLEPFLDLTEADAMCEGVEPVLTVRTRIEGTAYRSGFARVWAETNSKRAPAITNPWVWAITFARAEGAAAPAPEPVAMGDAW